MVVLLSLFFFFKQKTAYEMRISDWSSDVCSSDLPRQPYMARITVDDCLKQIPNRFEMSLAATYRARQLTNGAQPMLEANRDKQIGRASCRERVCQYV